MTELWTCPSCRHSFANVNQWHSCTDLDLDGHLEARSELAVAVFRRIESTLHSCGEFRIHAQKTRVAFIARMTFAGVRLAAAWADLAFITPAPIGDARIRSIVLYGPTSFNHHVRIASPSAVDADVEGWLCQAHRRGQQETLDPAAEVDPVLGFALERLHVPLHSIVVDTTDGPALRIPRWVVQAFAAHPYVLARVGGDQFPAEIRDDDGVVAVSGADTLESLGLGVGDETDVYLRADL